MNPRVYCVLGKPIGHSLSPGLHGRLFREHGLDAAYVAFETDDARGAGAAVRALGIAGASVTLPLKVAMLGAVDALDASARDAGAVNTLYWEGALLRGANTDADGVRASLRSLGVRVAGADARVLGAGGAARAVVRVLAAEGARSIRVAARGRHAAEDLFAALRAVVPPAVALVPEALADPAAAPVGLLVNATPVGMSPDVDALPIPAGQLADVAAVLDLVYNPPSTRLVAEARARGLPALGGMTMFAAQAARQFELWTGIAPDLGRVEAILKELQGEA